jgi:hypothetical protein
MPSLLIFFHGLGLASFSTGSLSPFTVLHYSGFQKTVCDIYKVSVWILYSCITNFLHILGLKLSPHHTVLVGQASRKSLAGGFWIRLFSWGCRLTVGQGYSHETLAGARGRTSMMPPSCGLSSSLNFTIRLLTWAHGKGPGSPWSTWSKEEEGGSCNDFYNLTLQVTHCHGHLILVIRSQSH